MTKEEVAEESAFIANEQMMQAYFDWVEKDPARWRRVAFRDYLTWAVARLDREDT